ncbi:hypothetical protein RIF29_38986 [Crotalaria pallida]|uniref:RNase H type-1 domain-containing protein n=1 Tax=Crotalaria pallida TaxID=3830 RepID=A0AAN9E0E1_CROPI
MPTQLWTIYNEHPLQAKLVWEHLGLVGNRSFWIENNVVYWLKSGVRDMKCLLVITLWWLWRARCEEVFMQRELSTNTVLHLATTMVADVQRCFGETTATRQVKWISWVPPINDVIVLNMDGSSLGNRGVLVTGAYCERMMVNGFVALRGVLVSQITFT